MRKRSWKKFSDFLFAMIASGLPRDYEIDVLRRVILVNLIIIVGNTFISILGTVALFQQNYLLMALDFSVFVILLLLYTYQYCSRSYRTASWIGISLIGIFFITLFYTGGTDNSAFVWTLTFPILSLYLLGTKSGTILSGVYALLLTHIYWVDPWPAYSVEYPFDLLLRIGLSYLVILIISFVAETVRAIVQTRLMKTNISLTRTMDALKKARDELADLAIRDSLTGIYNRRYFDEVFRLSYNQTKRFGGMLCFLIIDIDNFKDYNDHYGHIAGDKALQDTAYAIQSCVRRQTDMAFRYGGEEFAVILSKTTLESAHLIARDILKQVRQLGIEHDRSPHKVLTLSAGIACFTKDEDKELRDIIHSADMALYRAKQEGKDRFCCPDS